MAVDEEQIQPAVVVEIDESDSPPQPARVHTETAGECPVLAVVIEKVRAARQPWRSAGDGKSLVAAQPRRWQRRLREIEIDVVGDEEIQPAIAVVIEKRAAGAPARSWIRQPRRRSNLVEA